jgi:hypothetical protein
MRNSTVKREWELWEAMTAVGYNILYTQNIQMKNMKQHWMKPVPKTTQNGNHD